MPSTTSCQENGSANKPHYSCQRCTKCCRWPGFVKLTDSDISAISEFLGLAELDFIQ
jgi:hypothetical protein